MTRRTLTQADLASGDALFEASFGMAPKERLLYDQQDAIGDDLDSEQANLPKVMDVIVGPRIINDYEGDKGKLYRDKATFGGTAVYSQDRIERANLGAIAADIMAMLRAASPIRTGAYRRAFFYRIKGNLSHAIDTSTGAYEFATVIGVTNLLEYAAKLEAPGRDWPKPFMKTFNKARRKYSDKVDIRLRFISAESLGRVKTISKWKCGPYATRPIIEIAHLNRFGGNTGYQWGKRRTKRGRNYRHKKGKC